MARILVADDSLFARDHVRQLLEAAGHTVSVAGDGREAAIAYAAERPDAVVLDAVMPVLDGFEATSAILAIDPGARIVLVLPADRLDRLEGARTRGARAVLAQPGAWGRLPGTLDGVLADHASPVVARPSTPGWAPAPVERRPVAMVSSVLAVILALTVLVYGTGLQPATQEARALAADPGRPSVLPTLGPLPTAAAVPVPTSTPSLAWPAEPVVERARVEGHTFATYHMPDAWANYGQQFTTFCEQVLGYDCNAGHTRSLGEAMPSAEVISAFTNEGFDARAALGDIWSLTIADAAASGALAPYTSPRARALPVSVRGDGWVSPFAGVPGFIVSQTALARLNLPVPHSWADLAKPVYRGLVGMGTPGVSRPATAAFLAMSLGDGGTLTDYAPMTKLARALAANVTNLPSDVAALELGRPPIEVAMDYDLTWLDHLATDDGVMTEVVIPTDGSLYVPGAIVANGYDTGHMDVTKLFLDWVLSDVGQSIFAQYGMHPVRSIVSNPTYVILPQDRGLLLADGHYAATKLLDLSSVNLNAIYRFWTTEAGGS